MSNTFHWPTRQHSEVRHRTVVLFHEWSIISGSPPRNHFDIDPASCPEAYKLLASLLGYPDVKTMLDCFTDENQATLELLGGEHGYAIYKTLLARKEAV